MEKQEQKDNFQYCPICKRSMKEFTQIIGVLGDVDYTCNKSEDHHFTYRIRDCQIIQMRVRLGTGTDKLILKVSYDLGYSEVWSRAKAIPSDRIKVNHIVNADFSKLDVLKNKIKTMLVFS